MAGKQPKQTGRIELKSMHFPAEARTAILDMLSTISLLFTHPPSSLLDVV
jgi:hypothetical protein